MLCDTDWLTRDSAEGMVAGLRMLHKHHCSRKRARSNTSPADMEVPSQAYPPPLASLTKARGAGSRPAPWQAIRTKLDVVRNIGSCRGSQWYTPRRCASDCTISFSNISWQNQRPQDQPMGHTTRHGTVVCLTRQWETSWCGKGGQVQQSSVASRQSNSRVQ